MPLEQLHRFFARRFLNNVAKTTSGLMYAHDRFPDNPASVAVQHQLVGCKRRCSLPGTVIQISHHF